MDGDIPGSPGDAQQLQTLWHLEVGGSDDISNQRGDGPGPGCAARAPASTCLLTARPRAQVLRGSPRGRAGSWGVCGLHLPLPRAPGGCELAHQADGQGLRPWRSFPWGGEVARPASGWGPARNAPAFRSPRQLCLAWTLVQALRWPGPLPLMPEGGPRWGPTARPGVCGAPGSTSGGRSIKQDGLGPLWTMSPLRRNVFKENPLNVLPSVPVHSLCHLFSASSTW